MIDSYDLEMLTPPCDPGSPRLVAKAHLAVDIGPVLPYLNAVLSGAAYLPEAGSLTWKDEEHTIAFHRREIAVSDVEDRADAERVIDDLIELVNRTWNQRGEIVPNVAARPRPTPMAVYKLLPGTNCEDCGVSSCWQFGLKLIAGEVNTTDCPELFKPEYVSRLPELKDLIGETA